MPPAAARAGASVVAGPERGDGARRAAGLVNLGLRFLVELAAYGSLGYGGAAVGGSPTWRALVAVAAPLLALVVWTAFLAPKAKWRLGEPAAVALELVIFAVAAAVLASTGRVAAAVVLAAVAATNASWSASSACSPRGGRSTCRACPGDDGRLPGTG